MGGGAAARALAELVRLYQAALSPWKPAPSCRFVPTCSDYAVEALEGHGALRGTLLALGRLLRCHPLHAGGYDPPPRAPAVLGTVAEELHGD